MLLWEKCLQTSHHQNQPCLSSQTKLSCFVCHTKYYLWEIRSKIFDLSFNILVLNCLSKSLMKWDGNENVSEVYLQCVYTNSVKLKYTHLHNSFL